MWKIYPTLLGNDVDKDNDGKTKEMMSASLEEAIRYSAWKRAIKTCNYVIINANLGIKHSILMHVIILWVHIYHFIHFKL